MAESVWLGAELWFEVISERTQRASCLWLACSCLSCLLTQWLNAGLRCPSSTREVLREDWTTLLSAPPTDPSNQRSTSSDVSAYFDFFLSLSLSSCSLGNELSDMLDGSSKTWNGIYFLLPLTNGPAPAVVWPHINFEHRCEEIKW